MLSTILSAFTVAEIRKKLAFTALLLALYRLGSHIPVPGSTPGRQGHPGNFGNGNILGLLNTFSGGGLSRIAIFALGIMPYITASIILQLLTVVVPSLEKLQKEGEVGQARITQYTRYLTVGLAFAQSIGYVFLFRSFSPNAGTAVIDHFDVPHVFLIVISLTAGTILLMWMGELITQRGIGNGISLMIFASIVSRLPHGLQAWWTNPDQVFKVMMPFIALAVVAGDRVRPGGPAPDPDPVRQARDRPAHDAGRPDLPAAAREHGRRHPGDLRRVADGLPADGRPADQHADDARRSRTSSARRTRAYVIGESLLIILFTYFYTAVTFNPVDQADNLKKYGGFIPGVRPGRPTAEFLDRILARLTFPGALFLAAVAALPTILIAQTNANFFFGGTSLLIVIGVALDTMKQLEAQLMMRNYEGFLK